MIHPHTQVRHINDEMGYGVFATRFIPKGTIVYAKDPMEIEVSPEKFNQLQADMQQIVEKYSYIDERGFRIVSWDLAKYVNHCCNCNTMSSGYGFEIAIRDIQPGEEITDEYGMFNFGYQMELSCSTPGCRKKVTGRDLEVYYKEWDEKVKDALLRFNEVEQPLVQLLDEQTLREVKDFLATGSNYRSVLALHCEEGSHSLFQFSANGTKATSLF